MIPKSFDRIEWPFTKLKRLCSIWRIQTIYISQIQIVQRAHTYIHVVISILNSPCVCMLNLLIQNMIVLNKKVQRDKRKKNTKNGSINERFNTITNVTRLIEQSVAFRECYRKVLFSYTLPLDPK